MANYKSINYEVMTDTFNQCNSLTELKSAIQHSIKTQYLVKQEDSVPHVKLEHSSTNYIVSPKRSLEAASGYPGKKIAVLNFANNHTIGGAPFSAGAQEESICRCSTLYPCLRAMKEAFYDRHQELFHKGVIDHMGNDDLIYTPDVIVFKKDERTDPIYPTIMPADQWYKVDIITCAAPELRHGAAPKNYNDVITARIRRILDVAAIEHVETLILGAWGCGAFKNPVEAVARVFHDLLKEYDFETVEFALSNDNDVVFHQIFASKTNETPVQEVNVTDNSVKDTIVSLLKSTGRENIDTMISWMENHSFFEASASVKHHNAFVGGLAKHSLDVYYEAMELNKKAKLPITSVTLCALLHDVCKSDQYYIDGSGFPRGNKATIDKGHGLRSAFIVTRSGKLPLNYDEFMAIWWHMGEFEESLKHHDYQVQFAESQNNELCKLIHEADNNAAKKGMYYNRRFTGRIDAPIKENQIFVFNSYSNGFNKAGTAKTALKYYGAKLGIGEGLCGQSYAIPSELPLTAMQDAVNRFLEYAKGHPELEFLVTPIGIGKIFKRDPVEMANLFEKAASVENVILPEEFVNILNDQVNTDAGHSIGGNEPVNYKIIDHRANCDFTESAVMKQVDGRYTLMGLNFSDYNAQSGAWSGFHYLDSMKDFEKVLLPVYPKGLNNSYNTIQDFILSCVIVKRNGLWGCVSTRCEDYSRIVISIKYTNPDSVKEELKIVTGLNLDFVWKPYEEYIAAYENDLKPYPVEEIKNLSVFVGNITTLKVEAIVNAANSSLLGGGGIDGAIHLAAGPQLLEECKTLGGCKVGESKMTDAYNLPCKKIIHTVGPNLNVMTDMDKACDLLESCYNSVLDLAMKNNLRSVAFCCISTGIYSFPKPLAARIAASTIQKHPYDGDVQICCFTTEDKSYYDIVLRHY